MPSLSIHHYNVAVHDIDQAVEDYRSRFGMEPMGERRHNPIGNFDYQSMGYGDTLITRLITPAADDAPLARLMKERANGFNPHGEGMYLIAYECDDVDAFVAQVEANGGKVNRMPGMKNAWIHPTSSHFVLMEVVERGSSHA